MTGSTEPHLFTLTAESAFSHPNQPWTIYNVPSPIQMSRKNPSLLNQPVRISYDGRIKVGIVRAIERFCLSDNVPIRAGEMIGLCLQTEIEEGHWIPHETESNPAPDRQVMIRRQDLVTRRGNSDLYDWTYRLSHPLSRRRNQPPPPHPSNIIEWMLLPKQDRTLSTPLRNTPQ